MSFLFNIDTIIEQFKLTAIDYEMADDAHKISFLYGIDSFSNLSNLKIQNLVQSFVAQCKTDWTPEFVDNESLGHCLFLTLMGYADGFDSDSYPKFGNEIMAMTLSLASNMEIYISDSDTIEIHYTSQEIAL